MRGLQPVLVYFVLLLCVLFCFGRMFFGCDLSDFAWLDLS